MLDKAVAIALLLGPLIGGSRMGQRTASSVKSAWYLDLKKPWWSPPRWVFGPVWTVLYLTIGLAAAMVYNSGAGNKHVWRALAVFGAHMALNLSWTHVFFVQRNVAKASAIIVALVASLVVLMSEFSGIDTTSGMLLWPYLIWSTYAMTLTLAIWHLNPATRHPHTPRGPGVPVPANAF